LEGLCHEMKVLEIKFLAAFFGENQK
jgi:hypothetical protein